MSKEKSKLESCLKTGLKLYKFIQHNYMEKPNKNQIEIANSIIESLDDPKAKVANRLSLSRIPLGLSIPLTAYFSKNQWLILGMTTFYAISDFLDGFWSKHIIHHTTNGGSYLDAICDKIGAIELILPAISKNPGFLINGALEGIISAININNKSEGTKVKSTKLGKTKMWPLSAALICSYMSNCGFKLGKFEITKEEFQTAANILIPITAALETINIIEYSNISSSTEEEIEQTTTEHEKPKVKQIQKKSSKIT